MSPKNKGKFGKGKPAVEQTDEFISGVEKIANRLKPYAVRISIVVVVVTLGIGVVTAFHWWQSRKAKAATAHYIEAIEVTRREIVAKPADDAPPDPEPGADIAPGDVKPVTYTSTEDHANAVLAALEKVGSDTDVGSESELLKASALLELGRFDEALTLYRSYASGNGPKLFRSLASEGIGYVLEAKAMAEKDATARQAGLRQALEAFRSLGSDEGGARNDYASFHEARLLTILDDKAKAIELLQKIVDQDPPSDLAGQATNRLAVLKAPANK